MDDVLAASAQQPDKPKCCKHSFKFLFYSIVMSQAESILMKRRVKPTTSRFSAGKPRDTHHLLVTNIEATREIWKEGESEKSCDKSYKEKWRRDFLEARWSRLLHDLNLSEYCDFQFKKPSEVHNTTNRSDRRAIRRLIGQILRLSYEVMLIWFKTATSRFRPNHQRTMHRYATCNGRYSVFMVQLTKYMSKRYDEKKTQINAIDFSTIF